MKIVPSNVVCPRCHKVMVNAFDFQTGFIQPPGIVRLEQMLTNSLFKNRGILDNPSLDGRVDNRKTALRHHLHKVAIGS